MLFSLLLISEKMNFNNSFIFDSKYLAVIKKINAYFWLPPKLIALNVVANIF